MGLQIAINNGSYIPMCMLRHGQAETREKVVYEKSKATVSSILLQRNNLQYFKYVIYLYLVAYFIPTILCLSVQFFRISVLKFF